MRTSFNTFRILLFSIGYAILFVYCNGQYLQSTPVYRSPNWSHLRSSIAVQTALPTVTVRGFLNFRTTVDGTVIVFTPASAAAENDNNNAKSTPSINVVPSASIQSTTIAATKAPLMSVTRQVVSVSIAPTKVPINEYLVSPTPAFNDRHSVNHNQPQYPTGLVTVINGGQIVLNGATTVIETKVIGTYIEGKYAQILQTTSKVQSEPTMESSRHIQPSRTQPNIVSSALAPKIDIKTSVSQSKEISLSNLKHNKFVDSNSIQPSIRNGNLRNVRNPIVESPRTRLNSRLALMPGRSRWSPSTLQENQKVEEKGDKEGVSKIKRPSRLGTRRFQLPPRASPRVRLNRFKAKLPATGRIIEEETKKISDRNDNINLESRVGQQRPQFDAESEIQQPQLEHSIQILQPAEFPVESKPAESSEQVIHHLLPLDAAPIDPAKVVKEVQTITSEVTQHVNGNQIQVQTLTLTTTLERTLHPSEFESEGLIAPTIPVDGNDVEATSVQETPPLVISRTYSVTERSMRTTVVPVFDGTSTTSHTVTESFFIRKLITAYKTMPPGDLFLLETASNLMSMNDQYANATMDLMAEEQSVSPSLYQGVLEITTEPMNEISTDMTPAMRGLVAPTLDASMNQFQNFFSNQQQQQQQQFSPFGNQQLPQFGNQLSQLDMSNPLLLAAALQNPQLAAMYLGMQQLQQQAKQYNTFTKPTTSVTTETIYNTKLVSFYDGRATRTRTITEPMGTTERTLMTVATELVPVVNPNVAAFQQAQFQNLLASQFNAPQQLQFTSRPANTVTQEFTTVTDVTTTRTRIYTLVYNALSTKFRTVTSTSVFPTTVTSTITNTIQQGFGNTNVPFNPLNIFG